MKLIHFSLFIFLFSVQTGNCQTHRQSEERELARTKISKGKTDTNMVLSYISYGNLIENENLDSAAFWYQQAEKLSIKLNFPLGRIKFRTNYSYLLNLKTDYKGGLKLNLEALELARKNPSLNYEGKCLANVGISYSFLSEHKRSIEYFQKAADWFHAHGQPEYIPGLYIKIGIGLSRAGLYERAIEVHNKALNLVRANGDSVQTLEVYIGLGTTYYNLSQYKESRLFAEKAFRLASELKDEVRITESMVLLGGIYRSIKVYKKAEFYLEKALARIDGSQNLFLKTSILKDLELISFELKDYKKSEKYTWELIRIAKETENARDMLGHYQQLADLRANQGSFKDAYTYLLKYTVMYDTIQGREMKLQMQELNTRFQTSEKVREIQLLQNQNKIQDLKISQRNTLLASSFGGFFLVFLLGVSIIRNNRQKNKIQSAEIENLKKEKQLEALSGIITGEENERNRMAQDLHDGLGSLLTGVKLSLTSMKGGAIMSENQTELFGHSLEQLDGAIAEMRRVAHNLMPSVLVENGLVAALDNFTQTLNESGQIKVYFEHFNLNERLNREQEIVAYRMVQEAVNNALKHADAKQIIIQLRRDENQIQIEVEDDGKGFDLASIPKSKAGGLLNLQHRAEYLKGTFEIRSEAGKGATVFVEFPT